MPLSLDGGYSGNTGNTGTSVNVPTGSSGGGADWTDWIRTYLAVKSATQKPSFTQQPMSPEMKQVWQLYINNLVDPANKALGPDVIARAKGMADKLGAGSWTSPKTFSGDVGYQGTGLQGAMGGGAPLSPWGSSTTRPEHPIPNAVNQIGSTPDLARKFTPNMRTWEPASGFPFTPSMGESDPSREVSLDRAGHPLANTNPSGANGSLFQTGRDIGSGWAGGQQGQPFDINGAPSNMSRGDVSAFAAFMRSQGVKDAGAIAAGWFSGGLVGAALAIAKVWWNHYQSSKPKGGG